MSPSKRVPPPPTLPMISIVLIEDNRLVREGLTVLLNQIPDIRVVAAGPSADRALLSRIKADVILLDIGLRNGDSLRLAETLLRDLPGIKIIIMDLLPVHEELMDFVNAGVSGFILKDATLDECVNCVRLVAEGVKVLPPQMVSTLFSQIAHGAVEVEGPAVMDSVRMTPRERQVINLIADGLGNKEIAKRLHIATHTVKSHVRNVMEKLTLHTRLQIAAYAHRLRVEQGSEAGVRLEA